MEQRTRIIFARSPNLQLALQYARRIAAARSHQAKAVAAHFLCCCLVAHMDDSGTSTHLEA
jgi:hypothetical protein